MWQASDGSVTMETRKHQQCNNTSPSDFTDFHSAPSQYFRWWERWATVVLLPKVKVGKVVLLSHNGWGVTIYVSCKCTSYTEASRNNNQVKSILGYHLVHHEEVPRNTGTGGKMLETTTWVSCILLLKRERALLKYHSWQIILFKPLDLMSKPKTCLVAWLHYKTWWTHGKASSYGGKSMSVSL